MWSAATISSIFILFGLSVLSGILPCITVRCLAQQFGVSDTFKRAIALLNCFSGGVFFATCILDLLPEAEEKMATALKGADIVTEYPLTALLLGVGFLLILCLEHVAHKCCSPVNNLKQTISTHNTSDSRKKKKSGLNSSVEYKRIEDTDSIFVKDFEDSSFHDDWTYKAYGAVDESIDKTATKPYDDDVMADGRQSRQSNIVFQDSETIIVKHGASIAGDNSGKSTTSAALNSMFDSNNESRRVTNMRGIILLVALSLHMIFDGLALGLLTDETKIWQLLLALSLHKALVFFTIGLQIIELIQCVKKTVFAVLVFALISPLGLVIGQTISSADDSVASDMVSAILQSVATGTFIYVTFFEILQREFSEKGHDLIKVAMTILGFALIAVIRLFEDETG